MPQIVNWKKEHFTYFKKAVKKAFAPGNNLVSDSEAQALRSDASFMKAVEMGMAEFVEAKRPPSKMAPPNKAGAGEPVKREITDDEMVSAISGIFDPSALELIIVDERASVKVKEAAKTQLDSLLKSEVAE